MYEETCLFCSIIEQKIPAKIVAESLMSLAIEDINPKAPIHYLIMPKKHIEHMGTIDPLDISFIADMGLLIEQLSKKLPKPAAFNIISNNGVQAGQSINHMHWHFLSGKNIYTDQFQL